MNKLSTRGKRNKKHCLLNSVTQLLVLFFVFTLAQTNHAEQKQAAVAIYSSLSEDLFLASFHLDTSNVLEFKFLGSQLSSRRFTRLMLQNATVNNGQEIINQHVDAIEAFNRIVRVKGKYQRGDHLVFEGRENMLIVSFDGVELGQIESSALFNILLQSWIGEIPPSRIFKDAVLGQVNEASTTREVFDGLNHSMFRQQQIKAFVEARVAKTKANMGEEAGLTPTEVRAKNVVEVAGEPEAEAQNLATEEKPQPPDLQKQKRELEIKRREALEAARLATEERKRLEESQRLLSKALLQQGREKFARELVRHTQKNIRYPIRSRKLKQAGSVMAKVTIDREGGLLEFSLEDRARHRLLNEAVENGVRRSVPFPEVPTLIEGNTFTFQVPVAFALQ